MKNIIVTITNEQSTYSYDIEIPIDLEIEKLLDDIVQTLNGYNPALFLNVFSVILYSRREKKFLSAKDTIRQAEIKNGDYIEIRRKENIHG